MAPAENEKTGIQACDDYLSTYKACHRVLGIYRPDSIDEHYQRIRATLMEQSADPEQRADTKRRCESLARTMKDALHGQECTPENIPNHAASDEDGDGDNSDDNG